MDQALLRFMKPFLLPEENIYYVDVLQEKYNVVERNRFVALTDMGRLFITQDASEEMSVDHFVQAVEQVNSERNSRGNSRASSRRTSISDVVLAEQRKFEVKIPSALLLLSIVQIDANCLVNLKSDVLIIQNTEVRYKLRGFGIEIWNVRLDLIKKLTATVS